MVRREHVAKDYMAKEQLANRPNGIVIRTGLALPIAAAAN
jgi:hypothetical protein